MKPRIASYHPMIIEENMDYVTHAHWSSLCSQASRELAWKRVEKAKIRGDAYRQLSDILSTRKVTSVNNAEIEKIEKILQAACPLD